MGNMDLEYQFHLEMLRAYEAQCQVMRPPTRLRVMIGTFEGLGAALKLLESPTVGDGFITLAELGKLCLSVEALVLKEPWHTLFTEDQLAVARSRLEGWESSSI